MPEQTVIFRPATNSKVNIRVDTEFAYDEFDYSHPESVQYKIDLWDLRIFVVLCRFTSIIVRFEMDGFLEREPFFSTTLHDPERSHDAVHMVVFPVLESLSDTSSTPQTDGFDLRRWSTFDFRLISNSRTRSASERYTVTFLNTAICVNLHPTYG